MPDVWPGMYCFATFGTYLSMAACATGGIYGAPGAAPGVAAGGVPGVAASVPSIGLDGSNLAPGTYFFQGWLPSGRYWLISLGFQYWLPW